MKVILAQPRGFCADVVRSIEIVDWTLEKYAAPISIQNHRDLSKLVDVIPLVGAKNRSNSKRLREIGAEDKVPRYLIADKYELDLDLVKGAKAIGITAGASAPEVLVHGLIEALRTLGCIEVSTLLGVKEDIEFRLPPELIDA